MPLTGKQIAVTRPPLQGESLMALLTRKGATPLSCPLITISPCYDPEKFREVLSRVSDYDWLCFTSANGVKFTFEFAERENLLHQFRHQNLRFACIGPATAKALQGWGISPTLLPDVYQAEGLLQAFQNEEVANRKFLLLRARGARKLLGDVLSGRGGQVTEFPVYEALSHPEGKRILWEALRQERLDAVLFTSSSTVRAFRKLIDEEKISFSQGKVKLVSIGPITSQELRKQKLWVDAQAELFTSSGLVNALQNHYEVREAIS